MTATVLAATTADDPAGLPPSRLITPYWRSNPVVIASETNAAAMTARATDARQQAVDRWPRSRAARVERAEHEQDADRDDERDQEALASTEGEPELVRGEGGDHRRPHGGSGRGARADHATAHGIAAADDIAPAPTSSR